MAEITSVSREVAGSNPARRSGCKGETFLSNKYPSRRRQQPDREVMDAIKARGVENSGASSLLVAMFSGSTLAGKLIALRERYRFKSCRA